MTPPTGYTRAERIAPGVVVVPLRYVGDIELPRQIVGPGDVTILKNGEAEADASWKPLGPSELSTNERLALPPAKAEKVKA